MTSVLTTEEGDKKRQEDIIHFSVFPDSSMGGDNISAAPIDVDPKKPPPGLSSAQRRVYSKDHLEVYDLLGSPIWVFDIENKAMWWANEAACYLWSATDNESLCKRDFASDMSKASERSMNNWLEKFALGEDHRVTVSTLMLGLVFCLQFQGDRFVAFASESQLFLLNAVDISSEWWQRWTQNLRLAYVRNLG
jgi:hypothetical protein